MPKSPDFELSPPFRMHHLSGGMGFLLGSNRLGLILAPGRGKMLPISVPLSSAVRKLLSNYNKLRVLGRTTFEILEDLRDPVTDHFVIAACAADNKCLAANQERHWSGVANVLNDKGLNLEAALAQRIASQIHICTRRLERLSFAYKTVLSIVGAPEKTEFMSITCDKYARHIGQEYRSLLSELYNLRDAVNAAAFNMKYQNKGAFSSKKLKSSATTDLSKLGQLISSSMYNPSGDLLIMRMSLYRSVGQHYLGSNNPLFDDAYSRRIASGPYGEYVYLIFPLYDDIDRMQAIERGRPMSRHGAAAQSEAERFLRKVDHLDALEFSYDCFVRLLRIAELLAADVGLESQPFTLTDEDIIEATFADETGKVTRMKRDAVTGKLVEY